MPISAGEFANLVSFQFLSTNVLGGLYNYGQHHCAHIVMSSLANEYSLVILRFTRFPPPYLPATSCPSTNLLSQLQFFWQSSLSEGISTPTASIPDDKEWPVSMIMWYWKVSSADVWITKITPEHNSQTCNHHMETSSIGQEWLPLTKANE